MFARWSVYFLFIFIVEIHSELKLYFYKLMQMACSSIAETLELQI